MAQKPETIANPYLNARREWDERYGDQIARARSWRLIAMASMAVAGLAVAGVAYVGAQSKIKPFVVAIDGMGSPVAVAQPAAIRLDATTQRIAVAQVANWVWNARTILPDPDAQRILIDRVYSMASAATAKYLNEYYQGHTPFSTDGFVTRITINTVLPAGGQTYDVTWTESTSRPGQTAKTGKWKATVGLGVDEKLAQKPAVALTNPLGLYIKTLSWTQVVE